MKRLIFFFFLGSFSCLKAQYMVSAMINACGQEGTQEYILLKNGGSSFVASGSSQSNPTIDIRYGTTNPASTTYTETLCDTCGSSFVDSLNSLLSGTCDFAFVKGSRGTTVPANAFFIICDSVPNVFWGGIKIMDFNSWCGNGMGNVYVFFSSDNSWNSSGNFANTSGGADPRYFRTTLNSNTIDYAYDPPNSTSDGYWSKWGSGGGFCSDSGTYTQCYPTNSSAIPVILTYFTHQITEKHLILKWQTATEINNSHFTVYSSGTSEEWKEEAVVLGSGNSNELVSYSTMLQLPETSLRYYKLTQTDYDGTKSVIGNMVVKHINTALHISSNRTELTIRGLSENHSTIKLTDLSGKILFDIGHNAKNTTQIIPWHFLSKGIYLLHIGGNGNTDLIKVAKTY